MDQFLSAHGEKVTGTISVFDRLIIKGHLPLGYPGGMGVPTFALAEVGIARMNAITMRPGMIVSAKSVRYSPG